MATLHIYCCPKCEHEVCANPRGYDYNMSGLFINFKCDHCKEIYDISAEERLNGNIPLKCPECGSEELSTWNPNDGTCPKCGTRMEDTGERLMAD